MYKNISHQFKGRSELTKKLKLVNQEDSQGKQKISEYRKLKEQRLEDSEDYSRDYWFR
jgi:hypothetical protein